MITIPNEKELKLINIKMNLAYIKEKKSFLKDLEELKALIILENYLFDEQENLYKEMELSQKQETITVNR